MKTIDLNQTVGLLANIGVIAGIVFLVVELNQNNELLAAQGYAASTQIRLQHLEQVIGDHNVAGLVTRSNTGEQLTDEERLVLIFFYASTITGYQYSFSEFASGRVDRGPIGSDTWGLAFTAWPGLRDYWETRKIYYDPDFVRWMEQNVVNER